MLIPIATIRFDDQVIRDELLTRYVHDFNAKPIMVSQPHYLISHKARNLLQFTLPSHKEALPLFVRAPSREFARGAPL